MALDRRTIAELEKDGFTHIDACCASCGRIVQMPFKLLLTREQITKATKDHRAAASLPMPELREFTCGVFRPVATRRVDLPYRSGRSKCWIKVRNPKAPASTRIEDGTL
jgi:hypothetical protein